MFTKLAPIELNASDRRVSRHFLTGSHRQSAFGKHFCPYSSPDPLPHFWLIVHRMMMTTKGKITGEGCLKTANMLIPPVMMI